MRSWRETQPMVMRNVSKVGDWIYWGHCQLRSDTASVRYQGIPQFRRVYLPDMYEGWTAQTLPAVPTLLTASHPHVDWRSRFNLMVADEVRRRIILVASEGAFVYQIPADHGPNGTWYGPFNNGSASTWFATATQGANFQWGWLGIHRSDINQTFFRPNYCGSVSNTPKWNRIRWAN